MDQNNGIREPNQNTGVMEVGPSSTDFVAGGETAISQAPVLAGGDWTPFFSPGEWQKDMAAAFETDACVSFSACDALETYGNFCIAQNLWPQESVTWLRANGYMNPDGSLNFSDRFVARMSNTTTNGNSLPNVAQTIHDHGLVPESAWPFPTVAVESDPANAWAIYYADVPQNVQDLGKEFLTHFQPMYEWVKLRGETVNLNAALQVSPLQIATAVCWPWNVATPIQGCGPGVAHATLLGALEQSGQADILDHYAPFVKHFAPGYDVTYAVRHVLVPVAAAPLLPRPQHFFTTQLTYGDPAKAPELALLQQALQALTRADGTPYMKRGVFGPFGPQTAAALALFQKDHHIPDPQAGHHFGPLTRAALNRSLNA